MKKLSLKTPIHNIGEVLKRGQMKKILGGYDPESGMCDDWKSKGPDVCYNCCITLYSKPYCSEYCNA